MSFLDEVGKIAGAVAAEKGMTALDPDANFLEKAAAAIAGYEGAKVAEEKYADYQADNSQVDNDQLADDNQTVSQDDSQDNDQA